MIDVMMYIALGLIYGVLLILVAGLCGVSYNSWKELKREEEYYKTMNGPKS